MTKITQETVNQYYEKLREVKTEINKGIVGQEDVIEATLKALICGGHILFESVPGLAKTLLVRLLVQTVENTKFQRIQFTPDLLPTDIIGVSVYEEERGFYTMKGPIFANFVLADEINRAPPKVQSAMLQAMEEREVTISKKTYELPSPFCVLATQNPLEQQGVYPLALAQVDRFLFKVFVDYPSEEEELLILDQNAEVKKLQEFEIKKVLSPREILKMQAGVRKITISAEVKGYIMDIVEATRDPKKYGIEEGKYMLWGASPRASIYLTLASKANALFHRRTYVIPEDVREIAANVLRHRIMLNYEGRAKEIKEDDIIISIIKEVPVV